MALKYWFGFNDVKNITHRVDIYNDDYVGDSVEVSGRVSLSKAETEDTLEAIRGTGLSIDLEANPLLTFDDIYTSDERIYSIKYFRDGVTMFYGWISPSDIYESYVNNVWNISLDCIDGLGFLKNLSYVENSTGFPFSGKQKALDIIVNCLKRTNLNQNINTSIDIHYEGLSDTVDVLDNVYFNANRFIKDDDNTFMDCEEVLRSVLEIFGACITQHEGEWYIYKPNDFVGETENTFYSYDNDGSFIESKVLVLNKELGSQLDLFYPHYVNTNQQLSTENPIGAFSVNYKYGLVKSFFTNTNLRNNGDDPDPTIDEWTIDSYTYLDFPSDNIGVYLDSLETGETPLLIMTSDSFSFSTGNLLNVKVTARGINVKSDEQITYRVKVVLTDGATTYYLNNTGSWTTSNAYLFKPIFSSDLTYTTITEANSIPINGTIHIELYTPTRSDTQTPFSYVFISECYFYPVNEDLEDIDGEVHSLQVISNPSTKIQPVKEVYNGDNSSDSYIGTIYENDATTPTELWYRDENPTRLVPLLRIMGEERMKMYAKPLRVFSGDVFGYVNYLSVIKLNGFTGVEFMPIEYNYDAYNNITTLKLKQILNTDIGDSDFSGLSYSLKADYGKVVNPTITG